MTGGYGEIQLKEEKINWNGDIYEGKCLFLDIKRKTFQDDEIKGFIPVVCPPSFTRYFIHYVHVKLGPQLYNIFLIDNHGQFYEARVGWPREFKIKPKNKKYPTPLPKDIIDQVKKSTMEVIPLLEENISLKHKLHTQENTLNKDKYYKLGAFVKTCECYTSYYVNIIVEDKGSSSEEAVNKYNAYKVMGSWDNWTKEYELCYWDEDGLDEWNIYLDFIPQESIY